MQVVVLSPHRDDAAFSCGLFLVRLLRARASVLLVNVCTRSDYAPYLPSDGNPRLPQVSAVRLAEDEAFLQLLSVGASPALLTGSKRSSAMHDLAWLDAPLRLGIPLDQVLTVPDRPPAEVDRLAAELQQHILHADAVLAPVGLGNHVDHRLVRDAARRAVPAHRLGFYDDLPYAAQLSAAARQGEAADLLAQRVPPVIPHLFPAHLPGVKRKAVACYPSQVAPDLADLMEADAAQHNGAERLHLPAALAGELRPWLTRAQ